jgi:hypothetical protein
MAEVSGGGNLFIGRERERERKKEREREVFYTWNFWEHSRSKL